MCCIYRPSTGQWWTGHTWAAVPRLAFVYPDVESAAVAIRTNNLTPCEIHQ